MTAFENVQAAVTNLETVLAAAQSDGFHIDAYLDFNDIGERTLKLDVHRDDKMQPDMATFYITLRNNETGHGHTIMDRAVFAGKLVQELLDLAVKEGAVLEGTTEPSTGDPIVEITIPETDPVAKLIKPIRTAGTVRYLKESK